MVRGLCLITQTQAELVVVEKVFLYNNIKKMSEQKKQSEDDLLEKVTSTEYKYGFTTDIESDTIPKGLSEDVVRIISAKKNEPEWMLEYRLKLIQLG